jgi:hydrogenase-4 component H
MALTSKLKEAWIGIAAGKVTLPYPLAPHPPAPGFRGRPLFDASKCIGCGGCASNCPAREILIFDPCQELRVIHYLGRRCTSCGRCAEVCPEKAITMSEDFELATNDIADLEQRLTLFMGSCQRCGRCFAAPTPLDALKLTGYRVDDVEARRWVFLSRSSAPGEPSHDVQIEL